jgi:hypothetical protein
MTKIAGSGSGSISQRHGSADPDLHPDPQQNVMDPQHWLQIIAIPVINSNPCSVSESGLFEGQYIRLNIF